MFYEYKCWGCNTKFLAEHGMNESPELRCGNCNTIMKKVFSNATIHFNGPGFYVNDYKETK